MTSVAKDTRLVTADSAGLGFTVDFVVIVVFVVVAVVFVVVVVAAVFFVVVVFVCVFFV